MKRSLLIILILFNFSGCISLQKFNLDSQKDIENTKYIFEKNITYPYKKVFLAALGVIHDYGAEIFLKDYDKGLILIRDLGHNFSIPGKVFGLYLHKISKQETKIILKVTGKSYGLESAKPEDIFNAIEKEIKFREKIKFNF